jgi:LPS export ABC transporter protein LptC
MRKKRLRAALLVVVAAALAGIGYQVSHNIRTMQAHTLSELGADFLPDVAQHIRSFRRVKVENGRPVWEITAEDAQLFDATGEIVVREPRMTFHLKDGNRRAQVAGTEGRLALDGRDLKRITLRGAVVVRLDDLEMHTDEATYDRAHDLISAPGDVTVRGNTLDVTGRGMEVHVAPQQIKLLEDVHTIMRAAHAAS